MFSAMQSIIGMTACGGKCSIGCAGSGCVCFTQVRILETACGARKTAGSETERQTQQKNWDVSGWQECWRQVTAAPEPTPPGGCKLVQERAYCGHQAMSAAA